MAVIPEFERARSNDSGSNSACRLGSDANLNSISTLDLIRRCLRDPSNNDLSFLPELEVRRASAFDRPLRTMPNAAQRERLVDKVTAALHLPESWRAQPGQSADERLLAYGLTSMTVQLLGNIDAMDKLQNIPTFGAKFPFELPKGVSVKRDSSGRITSIDLGMPADLSKLGPEDLSHLHDLNSWLKIYQPKLEQITEQLGRISTAVEAPIEEKDIPVRGGQSSKRSTNPLSVNLIQARFEVSDDLLEPGNIYVEQTNLEQHVPWYGYQNSFGQTVSTPQIFGHSFKPDDYVVVERDGALNLVQAKFLASFKELEDVQRNANYESAVTMDLGLALTGGAEAALALRGGETAFAGGARFLGLIGGREGTVAAGATRALVGASGLLNNAGINESDGGREFNKLRGMLFLLEAGGSLAASGAARFGLNLPSSETALQSAAAVSPGVGLVRTAGSISFGLGIPVGGGLITSQLLEQVSQFGAPDYAEQALEAYSRGQELPRNGRR